MKMIHYIIRLLSGRSKKKATNFFDLPSSKRKRLIQEAGRAAQKKQNMLLKEYESRFGRA